MFKKKIHGLALMYDFCPVTFSYETF